MLLCTIRCAVVTLFCPLLVRPNGTHLSTLTLFADGRIRSETPASMRKPGRGTRMIIGPALVDDRMAPRRADSRIENLLGWFAASVLVTAGVIYARKPRENRRGPQPAYVPPRATPAQE